MKRLYMDTELSGHFAHFSSYRKWQLMQDVRAMIATIVGLGEATWFLVAYFCSRL